MHRTELVLALSACSLLACASDVDGDVPGATETTTSGTSTTTSGTTTTTTGASGDEAGESTVVGPTTMPDAVTSTAGGTSAGAEPPPGGTPTDPNLLVALVGDQGSGSNTRAVYQLIA